MVSPTRQSDIHLLLPCISTAGSGVASSKSRLLCPALFLPCPWRHGAPAAPARLLPMARRPLLHTLNSSARPVPSARVPLLHGAPEAVSAHDEHGPPMLARPLLTCSFLQYRCLLLELTERHKRDARETMPELTERHGRELRERREG